jgi:hypothetical protein
VKLKVLLLAAVGTAGVGASYALAASTKDPHGAGGPPCRPIHIHGTMASPSTFVITVQKAGPKDVVTTGQVVTLTVGGTGQTVVADAESCTTGTGTSATLTTRHVNVHVSPPPHARRGTTTTTTTTTSP